MPLYDYRCTECGREVEVMHGIHDRGPESCQYCGGAMRKALSPPAIHFKGSGWAKKDAAAKSAKGSKSKTGSGTGSSSSGERAAGKAKSEGDGGSAETSSSTSKATPPSTAGSTTT